MPKPRRITLPLPTVPDDRSIAEKLRRKLAGELAGPDADIETRRRDLRARILALQGCLRGGLLTDGKFPTAEGHITSAITLLQRELDGL